MSALMFRDMRREDASVLAVFEEQVEFTPWKVADFENVVTNGWHGLVAEAEGAGMVGWTAWMDDGYDADLLTIGIRADVQGRGWGRALLNEALSRMKAQGLQACFLEVRTSNTPARRLYETSGYKTVGTRKNYYPTADGREDAVVMRLGFTSEEDNA